jgi:hypothetical protein
VARRTLGRARAPANRSQPARSRTSRREQQEQARRSGSIRAQGAARVILRLYQLTGQRNDLSGQVITEKAARAAASANGSLFLTVNDWTGGNDEALQAVQDCVPYLIHHTF